LPPPPPRDVFNEMGIADSIKGVNNARAAASSATNLYTTHNTASPSNIYLLLLVLAAPNIPPHKGPPAAFCHFTLWPHCCGNELRRRNTFLTHLSIILMKRVYMMLSPESLNVIHFSIHREKIKWNEIQYSWSSVMTM
jgi:hypothetical protein